MVVIMCLANRGYRWPEQIKESAWWLGRRMAGRRLAEKGPKVSLELEGKQ